MSNLNEFSIIKEMEIDRNHIENYPMETESGTKRTKENFHKNAVTQRNEYVNRRLILFSKWLVDIENEMAYRIKNLMPEDKTETYNNDSVVADDLFELVELNAAITDSFKLKLDFLVASITDDSALGDVNTVISNFLSCFQKMGIHLSIEDFRYTMFTEKYMTVFLQSESNPIALKSTFEKIYYTCPSLKTQLKMNMEFIIDKYKKELAEYVNKIKTEKFNKYAVTGEEVVAKYVNFRSDLENRLATDEFINTKIFLDDNKKIDDYLENAPARVANFDAFTGIGEYSRLDDTAKSNFTSSMLDFNVKLKELKKYYKYEFIITDLLKKYKDKDSIKSQYEAKKKEIVKEEKNRIAINKEFLKASGIGFLAKKNSAKMNDVMLKMNEQIKKLDALYTELVDMEVTNNLTKLNDSSSILDLFIVSLSSFKFLEKKFKENEEFADEKLEDIIEEYFKFIYHPDNRFLRKINVLVEYNIANMFADKYKILDLAITPDMVDKDGIDMTLNNAEFINLVLNIERSNINLNTIKNLYEMIKIVSEGEENIENL